jgi:hypothetical protein
VADNPRDGWFRRDLANAKMRAGEVEEAIRDDREMLETGVWGSVPVLHWLGLALAHHLAGRDGEAREWLGRADAWVAEAVAAARGAETPGGLHANDWLTCQVLHREAAARLKK